MATGERTPKRYSIPEKCKLCGSNQIVRYGRYSDIQRWFCKSCKRKFVENDAPHRMRTPSVQIASALSMFYEGMSFNTIRRHINQTFLNFPSNSSVFNWVIKYTKVAVEANKAGGMQRVKIIDKLGHGPFWIANVTPFQIEGGNIWVWDIIDYWNRFLVVSGISLSRTEQDVKTIMEVAANKIGEPPGLVITSKLSVFREGIDLAFGSYTHHLQATSSKVQPYLNTIDRFHGVLKTRNNIIKSLKRRKTSELIIDGWLVHYNFFRPHESLRYSTPAAMAGIDFPYRNWLDVVTKGSHSSNNYAGSPDSP